MSIPPLKDVLKRLKKDWQTFRMLSVTGKILLVVLLLVVGLWVYASSYETPSLRRKVEERDKEITTLRYENLKLHNENLHLKQQMSPFERMARQRHPDLEAMVALSKLAEDIDDVRALAARAIFHPLSQDVRQETEANLKQVYEKYTALYPTVKIRFLGGDEKRKQIAEQLITLFRSVGIQAEAVDFLNIGGKHTAVEIYFHSENRPLAEDLLTALKPLWDVRKPSAGVGDDLEEGEVVLKLYATPEFLQDGVMIFQRR